MSWYVSRIGGSTVTAVSHNGGWGLRRIAYANPCNGRNLQKTAGCMKSVMLFFGTTCHTEYRQFRSADPASAKVDEPTHAWLAITERSSPEPTFCKSTNSSRALQRRIYRTLVKIRNSADLGQTNTSAASLVSFPRSGLYLGKITCISVFDDFDGSLEKADGLLRHSKGAGVARFSVSLIDFPQHVEYRRKMGSPKHARTFGTCGVE